MRRKRKKGNDERYKKQRKKAKKGKSKKEGKKDDLQKKHTAENTTTQYKIKNQQEPRTKIRTYQLQNHNKNVHNLLYFDSPKKMKFCENFSGIA